MRGKEGLRNVGEKEKEIGKGGKERKRWEKKWE